MVKMCTYIFYISLSCFKFHSFIFIHGFLLWRVAEQQPEDSKNSISGNSTGSTLNF